MKTYLSHLNQNGEAHMVDVGEKPITRREAMAKGFVNVVATFLGCVRDQELGKSIQSITYGTYRV